MADEGGPGRQAGQPADELSAGQQQRVAIARALLTDPMLVLADEPTGNLDSRAADEIAGLLHQVAKVWGHAVLMVTHDPRIAAYADRIIVFLKDGTVVNETNLATIAASERGSAAREVAWLFCSDRGAMMKSRVRIVFGGPAGRAGAGRLQADGDNALKPTPTAAPTPAGGAPQPATGRIIADARACRRRRAPPSASRPPASWRRCRSRWATGGGGDVLAQLDTWVLELQLAQAEANLAGAQARLNQLDQGRPTKQ